MILDVFPSYKDKGMVDLLYQFERATGSSLNILVEKYLEKMLYEKGYLTVEVSKEDCKDINQSVSKLRITRKYWNNKCNVHIDELNFSSFDKDIVEEVIEKLKKFPREDLEKISATNWEYPKKYYGEFILKRLDDDSLTPELFMESKPLFRTERYVSQDIPYVRYVINGKLIASFNERKYDSKMLDKIELFLTNQDKETLLRLVEKRKKLKEKSDVFLLRHIDNPKLIFEEGK